jgi:putative membrane protein
MNVKPFSEIVSDTKEKEQEPIKPFIDNARGGREFKEVSIGTQFSNVKKETLLLKTIHFLGSFFGVISVIAGFILVAILVDALQTIELLVTSGSFLDTFYLIALIVLLTSLTIVSYQNYAQIKSLKSVKKIQEFFVQQKANPSKEIIPVTLSLLNNYTKSDDVKLQQKAELLQSRISSSHEYKEIYKELDEDVVNEIDIQVQARIKTASLQAAISTAISPLAVVDLGIILWRSLRLTKEIAQLYGYKPGWIATVILLKKGAFNVFFAGATELAIEYTHDLTEASIISKISTSAAQGLSNGILLARLGFGIMQACRPLPMRAKRESFIKGIYHSIKELLSTSKEK